MIHIIPYIKDEASFSLTKEQITNSFIKSVFLLKGSWVRYAESFYDYEGILCKDGFMFRRIVNLVLSPFSRPNYSGIMPILHCKMIENGNKINLVVQIRFRKRIYFVLCFFMLPQIIFFPMDYHLFIVVVFPYLVLLYLFNVEANLLIRKFNKIINSST